jgi:hypothetical protein
MGISRWLFDDWFTTQELERIDSRHFATVFRQQRERQELDLEVASLRADVGKLALLTKSLATLCVDKGVLSRDDLRRRLLEIDLSDGVQDGQLDLRRSDLGA